MRRVYPLLLLAALLALLLSGCGASTAKSGAGDVPVSPGSTEVSGTGTGGTGGVDPQTNGAAVEPVSGTPSQEAGLDAKLKQTAKDVVGMLRDRDLEQLAGVIDPSKGLRFSPYPHIDVKGGRVFKPGELPTFKDTGKLAWGVYDGSGSPIELTFRDYFEKFVYDQDYAGAPNISVNKLLGTGNTKFNGLEVYPDASYAEFHFPGFDKSKDGMDWESLVLVFRPAGNDWKLCAIVHGQWTI
ncbi:hypothetical protein E5161_11715 [Cohnella pontilimi]|uniref:Lipoprotein n=1 Tax=Cohnella pontilimi TaxID=2564100 RepID=A0A4U0FAN1_9BACL|nr:hypothetical protein [Cohnella pontilimi]TJY41863.1 hypothetical protein E5161_11715 [Cohnella pontilimi]